jgi:hypothetical protein
MSESKMNKSAENAQAAQEEVSKWKSQIVVNRYLFIIGQWILS